MTECYPDITIDIVEEFRTARLHAGLEQIRALVRGKPADLLSYEDVREKVHAIETNQRQLKEIPLDAIVGSVGRYADFTRSFFPRQEQRKGRWVRVRSQVDGKGLHPIEAYQLGEVYFVIDGNHRVSVARSLGASHIEGYVTQVHATVPLTPDVDADELIIAERYAQFLESTRLNQAFPEIDLKMTAAGNYRVVNARILAHQKWMGEGTVYQDAAVDWYEKVYKPVVQIIRQRGMLQDFPQRTETDLYVWIMQHRQELAENLGWALDHEMAAVALVEASSRKPEKIFKRITHKLINAVTPDAIETGPMTGEWRKVLVETRRNDRLFRRVLVAISGHKDRWTALNMALVIAQREKGRVFGLHVCKKEADRESENVERIRKVFEQTCNRIESLYAGLRVETGNISHAICDSARWMDLVVLSLAHPPGVRPFDRLSSGFSQLLRRSPCPVLTVPQTAKTIENLLLAYDDTPASREALLIAAYLGQYWELPLTVVSVKNNDAMVGALNHARQYLDDKGIQARYIEEKGDAATGILRIAKEHNSDLIIMGNYGYKPLLEIAYGSTVDQVLRMFEGCVLVCR